MALPAVVRCSTVPRFRPANSAVLPGSPGLLRRSAHSQSGIAAEPRRPAGPAWPWPEFHRTPPYAPVPTGVDSVRPFGPIRCQGPWSVPLGTSAGPDVTSAHGGPISIAVRVDWDPWLDSHEGGGRDEAAQSQHAKWASARTPRGSRGWRLGGIPGGLRRFGPAATQRAGSNGADRGVRIRIRGGPG